ncbi:MAG: beta-propeller fold lactonase family protein [Angelakisella sp.]
MSAFELYIGTYTVRDSQGIYRAVLSQAGLTGVSLVAALDNPTWVSCAPNGQLLACGGLGGNPNERPQGELFAYKRVQDGGLAFCGKAGSGGIAPCHLAYAPSKGLAFVANYHSGSLSAYRLTDSAPQRYATLLLKELTREPDEKVSHAHCCLVDRAEQRLFVCDLGLDSIFVFSLGDQGELALVQRFVLPKGCGPRHAVLSPEEKLLYVVCELSSQLLVLDAQTGAVRECHKLTDSEFTGFAAAAAIRMDAAGQRLAVSCRGNDKLTLFRLGQDGGVTGRTEVPLSGSFPRDIVLTPDWSWLLAAYQHSDFVELFRLEADGTMRSVQRLTVPSPVCLCLREQKQ